MTEGKIQLSSAAWDYKRLKKKNLGLKPSCGSKRDAVAEWTVHTQLAKEQYNIADVADVVVVAGTLASSKKLSVCAH